MFELLLILTALVIAMAMWEGYLRTRDALMPMIVFGPMLAFTYVYSPAMLMYHGQLERFFPDLAQLEHVARVNLLGVGLFCFGCVAASRRVRGTLNWGGVLEQITLDERTRARLFNMACVFGSIAVAGFAYMVYDSGGPWAVFSRAKPFLRAASGVIGEMPMLAYPAIMLLAITLRGRKIRLEHVMLVLFFASPHLIMASLGGRRGPAFLILSALVMSWYVARDRRPSLRMVVGMVVCLGVLMLFLASNRRNLYLGSERDVDTQAFSEGLVVGEGSSGQEFIYASGMMLSAEQLDHFYWGRRYFTLLFVRPIPKFVWPTKYEDLGLGWMVNEPGTAGLSDSVWLRAVGFMPMRGSAGGFIADAFIEFWWFGVIVCYLIGRLYGYCWTRSVLAGQIWTVIYVELLVLSVYLPAQSVGAWLYRALLLIVPTWILWQRVVVPRQRQAASTGPADWQTVSARP
jgi:oligosaccharide repeat unit polymerase